MVEINDVMWQRIGEAYLCDVVYEGDFMIAADGVVWQRACQTYLSVG